MRTLYETLFSLCKFVNPTWPRGGHNLLAHWHVKHSFLSSRARGVWLTVSRPLIGHLSLSHSYKLSTQLTSALIFNWFIFTLIFRHFFVFIHVLLEKDVTFLISRSKQKILINNTSVSSSSSGFGTSLSYMYGGGLMTMKWWSLELLSIIGSWIYYQILGQIFKYQH